MIREKVIITKLAISQAGQIQHFQVKIPHDALRIIGIELSGCYANNISAAQPVQAVAAVAAVKMQAAVQPVQAAAAVPAIAVAQARQLKVASVRVMTSIDALFRQTATPMSYTASPFVGNVRLQSCENTNVFFSGDVYLSDENVGYGDYSVTAQFPATAATHGCKNEAYLVNTPGKTTILKGIYRDRQPAAGQVPATYTVNVYVWYETIITKL